MKRNRIFAAGVGLACGLALAQSAVAVPVVYTLNTVSDGMIGSLAFLEAPVTITFRGDTSNLTLDKSTGASVWTNHQGFASVRVRVNGVDHVAHFNTGQIYVRYDTTNGLVGFGSAISPTYPITIGCGNPACTVGVELYGDGTAQALTSLTAANENFDVVSAATLALPASLRQNTILTGSTHACPIPYATDTYGDSVACVVRAPAPGMPPVGALNTDAGIFYLQDQNTYVTYYEGNTAVFSVVTGSND